MSVVEGKAVLVIGGAGFVGSALVRELLKNGAIVVSYDNYFHGTFQNFAGLEHLLDKQLFVAKMGADDGNKYVFKKDSLREQINGHEVEYVINCIGDPFIPAAIAYADRCREINAEGTRSALEVLTEYNVKRIIHVSTCEVYGISNKTALAESAAINPCSTYAESKRDAEKYCEALSDQLKHGSNATPLIIARLFNCFGPRATHPYIIPEIIKQLNESPRLHLGNLTERDFTYVHDTAKALIALLTADFSSSTGGCQPVEVVNIGSGTSYKIDQIAKKIADLLGISKLEIITSDKHRRTSDIPRFVCDNTKLCQLTGWTPAISIEDGLSKTVEWFKDHKSRWNFSQNDQVNPVRSDEPVLQTARR